MGRMEPTRTDYHTIPAFNNRLIRGESHWYSLPFCRLSKAKSFISNLTLRFWPSRLLRLQPLGPLNEVLSDLFDYLCHPPFQLMLLFSSAWEAILRTSLLIAKSGQLQIFQKLAKDVAYFGSLFRAVHVHSVLSTLESSNDAVVERDS